MENISLWQSVSKELSFPVFEGEATADVVIIGGGITGIISACLLSQNGKKVIVLEAMKVGEGSTGNSTGNLYVEIDGKLKAKNEKIRKAVVESRAQAIDLIEKLAADFKIDCNFIRVPWHFYSIKDEMDQEIQDEKDALKEIGLEVRQEREILPFKVKSGLVLENQAQFNPLAFVKGLAKKIKSESCQIYENSKVEKIEEGKTCIIHTSKGKVKARNVIMATHTPKGILMVQTVLAPYREYGLAAKIKGEYPKNGIFWSTENPHHSVRTFEDGKEKFLVVIGENHKTGQEEDSEKCYKEVEKFIKKHFDLESVLYRWSAQNYKPADGLPYIGETSLGDNIFMATGFATDGLTYGALAAIILTDKINGKKNKWAEMYDSRRFTPLASAKDFIKENLNVLVEYLKDIPMNVDAEKFSEVKPGQGKTIEIDGEKYAAYRDEDKNLHVVSAVCTHMECIVNWNKAEKTWDCPCHGSRFTTEGEVIEGPAIASLPKKKF